MTRGQRGALAGLTAAVLALAVALGLVLAVVVPRARAAGAAAGQAEARIARAAEAQAAAGARAQRARADAAQAAAAAAPTPARCSAAVVSDTMSSVLLVAVLCGPGARAAAQDAQAYGVMADAIGPWLADEHPKVRVFKIFPLYVP